MTGRIKNSIYFYEESQGSLEVKNPRHAVGAFSCGIR